jgi:DNA repair protein RecN (Recombination protein N)
VLAEIYIENFAIIDTLHVQFSEGLNIVTGETGAGKSIMVDALMVALGGRAYSEFIRTGAEKSIVEALFTVEHAEEVRAKAVEYGVLDEEQEEQELLIRREISRSGRNRVLINGHPATNVMVAELGNLLVDIHGQHEHQSILNSDYHVDLLDFYGKLLPLREQIGTLFRQFKKVERELQQLHDQSRERMQHLDLLRFQQQEIKKARLRPGEDDELSHERKILAGAEQLASGANAIHEVLYSEHGAILERLGEVIRRMEDLVKIDSTLDPHLKSCESVQFQLEDLAFTIRDYARSIEFDPFRLEEVEKRLDELNKLKRKYGNSTEEILKLYGQIEQEIQAFDQRETHIETLEKDYKSLKTRLQELSQQLSDERKQAAQGFELQVMQELSALGMEKTRFTVDFKLTGTEKNPFTAKGTDKIEFLIAPNPGEPLKPLNKIASGGEISRIMLALKTLLGMADRIPTMIFDEIDAGIGGKIAEIVGKKLERIADVHQVVCITHLPQIASKDGTHFHVEKQIEHDHTITTIRLLRNQERLEEIARMLGGETITRTTLQHAREMLGKHTGDAPAQTTAFV